MKLKKVAAKPSFYVVIRKDDDGFYINADGLLVSVSGDQLGFAVKAKPDYGNTALVITAKHDGSMSLSGDTDLLRGDATLKRGVVSANVDGTRLSVYIGTNELIVYINNNMLAFVK